MSPARLPLAWERFLSLLPVFALASVAALWLLGALTLGRLDGLIPTHFDGAGNPDHLSDAASWWILPAIGTALTALMFGVARLLRWLVVHRPGLVNLPRKAAFVRLSPEARARIAPRLAQLVMGITVLVNLVLLAIIRDTYRVAVHEITRLAIWKLLVCFALLLVWTVVGSLRVARAIRRETQALAA